MAYLTTLKGLPSRSKIGLEEASIQLGLVGARVERARLSDYLPERRFVVISSRGVSLDRASLQRMARWLEPGGRLLLFTGRARSETLLGWRGDLREKVRFALAPELRAWLLVLEKPLETTVARPASKGEEDPVGGSGT